MEAIFTTLTDEQRVETLNNVYQKGLSTSKENLAFSADKLVYLKPFISRLQKNTDPLDLGSRVMVRQIIDELLQDIVDEVKVSCSRIENRGAKNVAVEYGLKIFFTKSEDEFYYTSKVA